MKIVLTYNKNIKLYNDKFTYEDLAAFVAKEFKLNPATIQMTFKDEEGDNITILSNDDLEVMQAVFEGKQYLKVTVEASETKAEESQDLKTEISETKLEAPQEEKTEIPTVEEGNNSSPKKGHCHRGRRSHSRGHGSPHHWSGHKKEKCMKMKGFFNDVVSRLVDERLKQMLPVLQQKMKDEGNTISEVVSDVTHAGTKCTGCSAEPITGIRYKCPTCPNFNFCENCELKIAH
jgi:hypothetical protein